MRARRARRGPAGTVASAARCAARRPAGAACLGENGAGVRCDDPTGRDVNVACSFRRARCHADARQRQSSGGKSHASIESPVPATGRHARRIGAAGRLRAEGAGGAGQERGGTGPGTGAGQGVCRRHRCGLRAVRVAEREGRTGRVRHRTDARGGGPGRHRGEDCQHAVGRDLQHARAGRSRHADLGHHDHRRAAPDGGLLRAVLRRPPADRGEAELQGREVRRPEEAQGRRADRHHRRRGGQQAAGQDQHQRAPLRVDAAGAEGTGGGRGRRGGGRQRRGRQLRHQQCGRQVQDGQRRRLHAGAVRHRGAQGQCGTARQGEQGAGCDQGRRQLRAVVCKVLRRRAGRRRVDRGEERQCHAG